MIYISGNRRGGGFFNNIGCLIFGALFLIGMFYFLRALYYLLWWAAPAFLVLALVINWRVVAGTGRNFLRLLERNPVAGIFSALLGVALFPLLTLFWFLGALGSKRIEKMQQEFGKQWGGAFDPYQPGAKEATEFVEFEELESKPVQKNTTPPPPMPPTPEPPPPPKQDTRPDNPYDDMFR
jgi:hypothetical protein